MNDPALPPSRFGAGYTVGDTSVPGRAVPASASVGATASPGVIDRTDVAARVNPLAVAAFAVVFLLGPLVVWLSFPMAFVARSQISVSGESGAGLAKAALVLSAVYLALAAVVLGLVVSGS